jgi:hypothetical protein
MKAANRATRRYVPGAVLRVRLHCVGGAGGVEESANLVPQYRYSARGAAKSNAL